MSSVQISMAGMYLFQVLGQVSLLIVGFGTQAASVALYLKVSDHVVFQFVCSSKRLHAHVTYVPLLIIMNLKLDKRN